MQERAVDRVDVIPHTGRSRLLIDLLQYLLQKTYVISLELNVLFVGSFVGLDASFEVIAFKDIV